MKKLLLASLITLSLSSMTLADTYVKGYFKKNGTYVQSHYRSNSDRFKFNNYSTRGNYNPYTGKKGYTNPYPSSYNKCYRKRR